MKKKQRTQTAWWLNKKKKRQTWKARVVEWWRATYWEHNMRFGGRRKWHSYGGKNCITGLSDIGEQRQKWALQRQLASHLMFSTLLKRGCRNDCMHAIYDGIALCCVVSGVATRVDPATAHSKIQYFGWLYWVVGRGNSLCQGCIPLPLRCTEVTNTRFSVELPWGIGKLRKSRTSLYQGSL